MKLTLIEKILFASFGMALVFNIGLTVQRNDLKTALKEKFKLSLGIFYQFILSPFIAYWIGLFFNLEPLIFNGLLLLSMTPCGSIPNILTKMAKGHSELSVAMTIVNSVMSLILLPIMVKIYLGHKGNITVPYFGILANLSLLVFFIILGLYINSKNSTFALKLKKITVALLGMSVLGIIFFSGKKIVLLFLNSPSKLIWVSVLLPFILYLLGLMISFLLKNSLKDSKALSLGAGTYNSPLTMTLIVASFPIGISSEVIKIPLLFTHTILIVGPLYAYILSKVNRKV
jgi:BASS family bile acid:Na+ symporter